MLRTMNSYFETTDREARRELLKPWADEARELLKLSAPLVVMQLAQIGALTADIIMVGALGKEALAATAIGAVAFYLVFLLGYGPVMAVSPIVAQILGASPDDRTHARAAVRMGLWAVGLMSVPLMALLIWAKPALLAVGQDPNIAAMAEPWIHAIVFGLPFAWGFAVLRGFATAIGRQRAVIVIAIMTVLVNVAANYVLIYGKFGSPAFGVQGSGIASAIAYAFSCLAMLGVVLWSPTFAKYRLLRGFWTPDWHKLGEVFHIGIFMGLSLIFEAMFFNTATLMMGAFGAASVAAHQISLNVPSLTFMVPLGIGLAATVRVGLFAGARSTEGVRRAGYTAILIGCGFMLVCGIVIALIPRTLAGLYVAAGDPANADVMTLVSSFLLVAAAFQLFDALQVTAQMSLRGLKDTMVPMWIALLSYWLVGFTLAYCLAFVLGMKGFGVWLGLLLSLIIAGAGMLWRWEVLSRRPL